MPPYWTELPIFGQNPLSLLHGLCLGIAIYFSHKNLKNRTLGKYFVAGLLFKLSAGIGISLLYYHHYQYGDIIQSFKIAGILRDIFWENPQIYFKIVLLDQKEHIHPLVRHLDITPRAIFFYKLLSPFSILTAHNFWFMVLYWSFLGYLAMWFCASKLAQIFGKEKAWAAAFLFCPSVVVWTSGLFKENVFWIAFSILMIGLFTKKITFFQKILFFIIVLLCFGLIFQLKYYYFAVIAPIWLSLLLTLYLKKSFDLQRNTIPIFLALFFLFIFAASFLHPNLRLDVFLQSLENNYFHVLQNTKHHNLIEFETPFTWFSVFYQTPKALIASFLQPFVWEEGNFLKHLVGIENAVLVGIFLYGFWKKRPRFSFLRNSNLGIFSIAILLYILILAILLPFSAPNIGSLVRYKVSFMPFLVYFLTFRFVAQNHKPISTLPPTS